MNEPAPIARHREATLSPLSIADTENTSDRLLDPDRLSALNTEHLISRAARPD
jgi:hypothetical protein